MQSVERYMKQAIVDRLSSVASAALTSSIHLMRQGPEVVKRWVNEVQEAVNHENIMVQYHALGLLYQIRRLDKHAVKKLIGRFAQAGLRSPYAYCFLIRIAASLINEDGEGWRCCSASDRQFVASLSFSELTVRCTISSTRVFDIRTKWSFTRLRRPLSHWSVWHRKNWVRQSMFFNYSFHRRSLSYDTQLFELWIRSPFSIHRLWLLVTSISKHWSPIRIDRSQPWP